VFFGDVEWRWTDRGRTRTSIVKRDKPEIIRCYIIYCIVYKYNMLYYAETGRRLYTHINNNNNIPKYVFGGFRHLTVRNISKTTTIRRRRLLYLWCVMYLYYIILCRRSSLDFIVACILYQPNKKSQNVQIYFSCCYLPKFVLKHSIF